MPKSPPEQEKPFVIEEDSNERRSSASIAAAGISAVTVLAIAKEAQAAATPFDDAVNNLRPDSWREAQAAQFTAGPTDDRFDMVFSARNPDQIDLYRAYLRAEANPTDGGVIFRRLGPVNKDPLSNPDPSADADGNCVEYIRPDGRRDVILSSGGTGSWVSLNGENVWPFDESCPTGSFVHPSSRNPRELKVSVNFAEAFGNTDADIYRVPIDAPNFCEDIRDRILAANASGADVCTSVPPVLQCNAESIVGSSDRRAPETMEFEIKDTGGLVNILKWNSATGQYDIFMQRGADGCYTEACGPPYDTCPAPFPFETGFGTPSALLTTPLRIDGRTIYPYVGEYTTASGGSGPYPDGRPHLEAMAFELMADGNPCEVPVTMEADEAAVVDDDRDDIPNEDDTCAWVQEAAGIDVGGPAGAADGIGDVCQTTCENWPAVNPPAGATSSDFWACASTEIIGYDNQLKRGDGSTLLTDFPVAADEFADGALDVPAGGDFYWMHAQAAQFAGAEVDSPVIQFAPGNSASVEVLSTSHPNGDPGTATFIHREYPDGVETSTPLPLGTSEFDPGIGDELVLSGSVVRGSSGTEGWPTSCASGCLPVFPEGEATPVCPTECALPTPDGGSTPDGGPSDGGSCDGGPCDAGNGGTPDANGQTPDASGGTPDANGGTPDANGQTPDANPPTPDAPDAAGPKPDAARPDADGMRADTNGTPPDAPVGRLDAGPPITDADGHSETGADASPGNEGGDHGGGNGGCHCSISQPDRGDHAPLSLDGAFMMAPLIGALLVQRRRRFMRFLSTAFTPSAFQK